MSKRHGQTQSPVHQPSCPRCGKNAKCKGWDIGGVDYYDYFVLWCNQCKHVTAWGTSGGSPYGDANINPCPFCGIEATGHGHSLPKYVDELIVDSNFGDGVLREGIPLAADKDKKKKLYTLKDSQ